MKEETLVELLERRFVTSDGVIIWNEQIKGLINNAMIANLPIAEYVAPDIDSINNKSNPSVIDFIKWYSGMSEEKILNAYARYLKEKT